jgi:hypothetical protein
MPTVHGLENQQMITTIRNEGGITLLDGTDLAVATYYYPDSDGRTLNDYNFVSLSFYLNGGTITFETPVEVASPTYWSDITNAGYCLNVDDTSAGPYTATWGSPIIRTVDWERLMTRLYRIKVIPTGATNRIIITAQERFV